MTDVQGLTAAISPTGIAYFTQTLLAPALTAALAGLTPPAKTISVPDIQLWASRAGFGEAQGITITLSSGQLGGFSPQFTSVTQGQGGQFTLLMTAPPFSCAFNWNEQYDYVISRLFNSTTTPVNNTYPYTVGFTGMTIAVVFTFEYVDGEWAFTFVSATPTPGTAAPNIPSASVVNAEEVGCFTANVSDATKTALDTIDFGSAAAAIVKPLFSQIPSTGRITQDITFQFEEGPAGLTFPGDAGLVAGVSGVAAVNGTPYAGPNPPTLPTPTVPTDRHLAYNVSDYTINSLLWAFFTAGDLHQQVGPGNIPDPEVLNTDNYDNTPLQALYDAYPSLPMTAAIDALAASTVSFQQIYSLTDAADAALQPQLPDDVYGKLQTLLHQAFLAESTFYAALGNALGQSAAGQYKTIIEAQAQTNAAVVTHDHRVVLSVVKDGAGLPVITFDVAQTDVLQGFGLGVSGAAQSLKFAFQIIPGQTRTTFVSSTVQGVDRGDFQFIWNLALQPAYAATVAKMGQAGVALPRIPGFDFVFSDASITVQQGYVDVLTDVQHTTDRAATLRLASKLVAVG